MNFFAFIRAQRRSLNQCLGNYNDTGRHTVQTNVTLSGKSAKLYNKVLLRGLPSFSFYMFIVNLWVRIALGEKKAVNQHAFPSTFSRHL